MVAVPLSFSQRLYLLWTFRHFRQLSPVLLNSRQKSLVNQLFREHPAEPTKRYDPLLVIGVVENFTPPQIEIADAFEEARPRSVITEEVIARDPVVAQQELVLPQVFLPLAQPAEVQSASFQDEGGVLEDGLLQPVASVASSTPESVAPENSIPGLSLPQPARPARRPFRLAFASVATAIGVAVLGVTSVIAYHRLEAVPASEAHSQTRPEPEPPRSVPTPNPQNLSEPVALSVTPAPTPATAEAPLATPATAADAAPPKPVAETPNTEIPSTETHPRPPAEIPLLASAKPVPRVRPTAAQWKPVSLEQDAVSASRPPLRFVYPVSPGAHVHGVIKLTASVDSAGTVRGVKVVSGNGPLAAAAVHAVRQWLYRPVLKEGQPVPTETNIVISFLSSEAVSMSYPSSMSADR